MERPSNGRPGIVFSTIEERSLCFPAMLTDDRLRLFAFECAIADEFSLSSAEWHLVRESLVLMHSRLRMETGPDALIRLEQYDTLIEQADALYAETIASFTGMSLVAGHLERTRGAKRT